MCSSCCVEFQRHYCRTSSLTLQKLTPTFFLCRRFSIKMAKKICLTDNVKQQPRDRFIRVRLVVNTSQFKGVNSAGGSIKNGHS